MYAFEIISLDELTRNRTGEERWQQALCDKRDNNFVWNISPIFTFF